MAVHAGTAFVDIEGDFNPLEKGIRGATDNARGKFKALGKAAAVGLAAGVGGAVVAVKSFVDAAMESEKSGARMKAQLKALGISYADHAKQIDKAIQKTSDLAGLDDEDLQDAFTNIVRATGDVNDSLKLTGLAADFARAKHMDVAKAGEVVAKVANGNVGILKRYGVQVKDGASTQEALAAAQQKFAGQAEAYGKTAAGAQDRFKVAVENLQESLGQKLLPIVTKVFSAVSNFVTGMQNGTGAGGKFAEAMRTAFAAVRDAVATAIRAVNDWLEKNRDTINDVAKIVDWWIHHVSIPGFKLLLDVAERIFAGLKQVVDGFATFLKGIVEVISGVLQGDFGKAWDGVKHIFSGAVDVLLGIVRAATAPFREAISRVMGGIIDAIKAITTPFVDAGKWIVNRIADGIKTVTDAIASVGGWIKNRVVDYVQMVAGAYLDVGKWIVNRIADGITTITDALSSVGGWIKNRVVDGLHSVADAFLDIGGWVINKIVNGITSIAGIAKDVGGWIKDRVEGAWDFIKDAAGGLGGKIGGAILGALKGVLRAGGDFANAIIDLINDAIPNKIPIPGPVPDIDLPDNPIPHLATGASNFAGGWAVTGEEGPELIRLPRGSDVYPHRDTMAMIQRPSRLSMEAADAPIWQGDIYIGGEKIDERVDVRLERRDRAITGAYRAGVLAS